MTTLEIFVGQILEMAKEIFIVLEYTIDALIDTEHRDENSTSASQLAPELYPRKFFEVPESLGQIQNVSTPIPACINCRFEVVQIALEAISSGHLECTGAS